MPALRPATRPLNGSIDPTAGLLLLQVPPPVPSARVVVWPTQMLALPVTGNGRGLIVMVVVAWQPVGRV